jgi:hypothetical protein
MLGIPESPCSPRRPRELGKTKEPSKGSSRAAAGCVLFTAVSTSLKAFQKECLDFLWIYGRKYVC